MYVDQVTAMAFQVGLMFVGYMVFDLKTWNHIIILLISFCILLTLIFIFPSVYLSNLMTFF